MVRYIMSFTVPREEIGTAQKIIDNYFETLSKQGPAGMRSQCYATDEDDCHFVHIKGFKKESVANQHFKSFPFKEYLRKISEIATGQPPTFSKLEQQQTFESIY